MSTNPIAESPLTASFDAFYREDRQRLIQFLVSLGAPRADAEDIVQEAMAVTFNAWSRASISADTALNGIFNRCASSGHCLDALVTNCDSREPGVASKPV